MDRDLGFVRGNQNSGPGRDKAAMKSQGQVLARSTRITPWPNQTLIFVFLIYKWLEPMYKELKVVQSKLIWESSEFFNRIQGSSHHFSVS